MNIDLLFSNFELLNTPEKIQKLKQAILQLAIQGKLVPQDPNDEPASEIIKRIKAEKEKLTSEAKIKKQKPLPSLAEEEFPYELPNGWELARLGDIIKISSGDNLTIAQMLNTGSIPVYGGNGITGYHNQLNVIEKTIVIGRVGYYCGSVHLTGDKAWITDNAFITKYSKENIDRDFLVLLLKGTNLKQNESATAQPVISGRKIYPIIIGLPPLNEQKRIVEKVDQLFSRADEIQSKLKKADGEIVHLNKSALNQVLESKNEEEFRNNFELIVENFDLLYSDERNVKELRQAILQLAVQGRLVPQDPNDEPASELINKIKAEKAELIKEGKLKKEKLLPPIPEDEIPHEVPNGWRWVRLGEITKDVDYGTSHKSSAITQGIPILGMGNVREGSIRYDSYKYVPSQIKDLPRLFLKKNDMLFNRTNSYDLVGKTGIYKKKDNSFTFASYLIRVSFLRNLTKPEYINIFFNTSFCRKTQIEPEITKQTNQANFNGTKLKNVIVPLPPLTEQKRIVEKVDELMKLCDELESKIQKSKEESERLIGAILQEVLKLS